MSHPRSLVLLALALSPAADAATYCVENSAELTTALAAIQSLSGSHTIQLQGGSYVSAAQAGFTVTLSAGQSLLLEGGWAPFFDNDCGLRFDDPTLSVIDGGGVRRALTLNHSGGGGFTVRGITFANGLTDSGAGGLTLEADYSQNLVIERNVFRDNVADVGGALRSGKSSGELIVRNNLFLRNRARTAPGAYVTSNAGASVILANNTWVENRALATIGGFSRGLALNGSGDTLVVNNLFWDNTSVAPSNDFQPRSFDAVLNNNIQSLVGNCGPACIGNTGLPPEFVGVDDFRLSPESPLRNAGYFEPGLLGERDLDGRPRRMGRGADIGAYEIDESFGDGFE